MAERKALTREEMLEFQRKKRQEVKAAQERKAQAQASTPKQAQLTSSDGKKSYASSEKKPAKVKKPFSVVERKSDGRYRDFASGKQWNLADTEAKIEQDSAWGRAQQRREQTGARTAYGGEALRDTIDWMGNVNKLVHDGQAGYQDIDQALQGVSSARAGAYFSKLRADQPTGFNDGSELDYVVGHIDELEAALKQRKESDAYKRSKALETLDIPAQKEQDQRAEQLIEEWNNQTVQYNALIDQLGVYRDMPVDPLDPTSVSLQGTNEQARLVEADIQRIGQELAGLGYDLGDDGEWTALGAPTTAFNQLAENRKAVREAGRAQADDIWRDIPDYAQAAEAGLARANPTYDEVYGRWKSPMIDDPRIANKATFARDNREAIEQSFSQSTEWPIIRQMTYWDDEDIKNYSAILEAQGVEAADEWGLLLDKKVEDKRAENFLDSTKDRPVLQTGVQFLMGGTGNLVGKARALGADTEKNIYEKISEGISENLSQQGPTFNMPGYGEMRLGQAIDMAAHNFGNMTMDIIANQMDLPGWLSTAWSAGGNTYAEAFESGEFTQSEAQRKALMTGSLEGLLGKGLSTVAEGGGQLMKSLLKLKGGISQPVLRRLMNVAAEMISEGAEEYGQEILDPITSKLAKGEEVTWEDFDWDNPQAILAGYVGAGLAGPVSISTNIASAVDSADAGKAIKADGSVTVEDIIQGALAKEQNTRAYKLGRKSQEIVSGGRELSDLELGDLFFASVGIPDAEVTIDEEAQAETEASQAQEAVTTEEQAAIEAARAEEERLGKAMENAQDADAEDAQRGAGIALTQEQQQAMRLQERMEQLDAEERERAQGIDRTQSQALDRQAREAHREGFGGREAAREAGLESALDARRAALDQQAKEAHQAGFGGREAAQKAGLDRAQTDSMHRTMEDIARQLDAAQQNSWAIDAEESERAQGLDLAQERALARQEQLATENAAQGQADAGERAGEINPGWAAAQQVAEQEAQARVERVSLLAAGLDENTTKAYLAGYKGDVAPEAYDRAFRAVYQAAGDGLSYEQIGESAPVYMEQLGLEGSHLAYFRGEADYQARMAAEAQAEQARMETLRAAEEAEPELTTPGTRQVGLNREYSQGTKLTSHQEGQLRVLDAIGKKYGLTIVAQDSIEGGKANGKYEGGTVYIAMDAMDQAYLYVGSHEMTHYIQENNADEYAILRDYVMERLQADGLDVEQRIAQRMEGQQGLEREAAIDEMVADAAGAVLADEANVKALVETNRNLAQRIRDWIGDFVANIRASVKRLGRYGGRYEIAALEQDGEALTHIYDMFTAALEGAQANREGVAQVQETEAQYSIKEAPIITGADVDAVQDMPRGSVSQFTSEQVEASENWAKKFYVELGEKSPFFRAWFGDWRAKDTKKIKEVQLSQHPERMPSGTYTNADTGWNVTVGDQIRKETVHQGIRQADQTAVAALGNIQDIIANAVLLDTQPSRVSSKSKLPGSSFMHSLYVPYRMDSRDGVLKLYVEESWNKNTGNTFKRGYELKNITTIANDAGGVLAREGGLTDASSATISTVADLFAAVKRFDKDFKANEPSTVVNEDGTPKVVYHGTNASDIRVFNTTNMWGTGGLYLSDNEDVARSFAQGKDAKVYKSYVNMRNPFVLDAGNRAYDSLPIPAEMAGYVKGSKTTETNQVAAWARENGYDGVIIENVIEAPGFGTDYIIFSPTQIKSATDNIGTFDRGNPDIRYSLKDLGDAGDVAARVSEGEIADKSVELVANLAATAHTAVEQMTLDQVRAAAKDTARKMIRRYQSGYDLETLEDNLTLFYGNVAGVTDWADAVQIAADLGKAVVEQSQHLDSYLYEQYKDLRETLRDTGLRLSEAQKQEIASQYGSVNDWRKQNFGRLRITGDGTPLDVVYQELAGQYPELFDADVNEAEMPFMLTAALDAVKPTYRNLYGMDNDGAALDAGMEMLYSFFDTAIKRQGNNVAAEKARLELKQQLAGIRQQYKQKYEQALAEVKKDNVRRRQELARKYRQAAGKAQKEALQKQYQRMTDRRNSALDRQKAHYDLMRASERARRAETGAAAKYRGRIEKTAGELKRWLERPSDKQHVPQFVREPVLNALNALEMMGHTDAKTGSPRETLKGINWRESLRALTETMRGIQAEQEGAGNSLTAKYRGLMMTVDPDLIPALESMVAKLEGKSLNLRDMNAGQLKDLHQALTGIRAAVTSMGKTWANARYRSMAELGDETVQQLGQKKARKRHDAISNFLEIDQLDSFSLFKELGGAAQSVLDGLYGGWQKSVSRIRQASEATDAMLGDLKIGKNAMRLWQTQGRVHTLESGRKLTLTPAQAMDLYNLWQRPQAREHILRGGVEVEDIRGGLGKRTAQSRALLTEGDVQAIIATLTKGQKALCDNMRGYLATEAAAWGNETSMELYLYEKFGEENYWPIRSSRDFLRTKGDEGNTLFNAIRNMGFTKALTPGASNPVRLGDALQVYSDHIVQMATYNGLAAPMEDAMKWYNYTQREDAIDGSRPIVTSVKEQLRLAMGKEGMRYVENLLRDINGMSSGSYGTELGNSLMGKFKASAIAGSVRVMIQQPTAILRATAEISPKYLLSSHTSRRAVSEMQRYAPIAWWKAQGNFDLGIGQSMRQIIVGDDTRLQRLQGAMMAGAGYMDDMTWGHLWNAVKAEVRRANPDIQVGSEAYFDKVRDRFTAIVNSTQVVDSVFHRSQVMRSKDGLSKMATAFMAEPTKSYNLLRGALTDAARGVKGAKAAALRTTLAWTASVALNAAVKGLWDAWRKRDEDDDYWQLFRDYWMDSFGDDMNVLNMIPWVKDALAILQGYDVERVDMSLISDLWMSVQEAQRHFFGEGTKKSDYAVISNLVKKASAFTGIPLNGLLTSVEGAVNGFAPGAIVWTSEGAADSYAALHGYIMDGQPDKAAALRQRIQEQARTVDGKAYNKMGYTIKADKEIDAGVAKLLALGDGQRGIAPDGRIAQAWAAREAADTRQVDQLKAEMVQEGWTGEMFDGALEYYGQGRQQEEEARVKDLAEPLNAKLYHQQDLMTAFDRALSGKGYEDIRRVADEIMADSEAADPEQSVKSILSDGKEGVKPRYIEAYRRGDEKAMKQMAKVLSDNGWFGAEDLNNWVASDIKAGLWTAIEQGDVAAAQKAAAELIDSGLVAERNSLLSSINGKYGPVYKELYFSGRTEEAAALAAKLQALELRNNKGEKAYSDSWIKRYWRSKSAQKAWDETRAEQQDSGLITGRKAG